MLMLGACWTQTHFGKKHDVGEIQMERKEARGKKMSIQRKKSCETCMKEHLAMIGLGF
jgi:hypothetical protein